MAWLKTLKKRHEELLALRNDNAHRERRFYGASADKEILKEPVYDVKVLDRLATRVARDWRESAKTSTSKWCIYPSATTSSTAASWSNGRRMLTSRPPS